MSLLDRMLTFDQLYCQIGDILGNVLFFTVEIINKPSFLWKGGIFDEVSFRLLSPTLFDINQTRKMMAKVGGGWGVQNSVPLTVSS